MAMIDRETLAKRVEALRLARADSLIEGLREHEEGASVLDAWARGDITGDELDRRILAIAKQVEARNKATAA
jgi:hypothetical protein